MGAPDPESLSLLRPTQNFFRKEKRWKHCKEPGRVSHTLGVLRPLNLQHPFFLHQSSWDAPATCFSLSSTA